ncbi:Chaperone protein dnaJ 49 [Acorus gramineus]|uniref:Chaperone protein dnaJ 49 n=1 Tax=Acorus gramineus TaxID=55184 RepID=A0AAV9BR77_ACOGR|nr:Chaperone protein dnaJ 49 [Acorus gramineus]
MAAGGEGEELEIKNDFYAVLGLQKECSASDLRVAYKKLALMWHPDRISATRSAKYVEEAKKKFQDIQEAYSVLSDTGKRLLYDVGVYDSDDDDDSENRQESFADLQDLFEEMFHDDMMNGFGSSSGLDGHDSSSSNGHYDSSSSSGGGCHVINCNNKRESSSESESVKSHPSRAAEEEEEIGGGRRRSGRKQKVSSLHDVSSRGSEISA